MADNKLPKWEDTEPVEESFPSYEDTISIDESSIHATPTEALVNAGKAATAVGAVGLGAQKAISKTGELIYKHGPHDIEHLKALEKVDPTKYKASVSDPAKREVIEELDKFTRDIRTTSKAQAGTADAITGAKPKLIARDALEKKVKKAVLDQAVDVDMEGLRKVEKAIQQGKAETTKITKLRDGINKELKKLKSNKVTASLKKTKDRIVALESSYAKLGDKFKTEYAKINRAAAEQSRLLQGVLPSGLQPGGKTLKQIHDPRLRKEVTQLYEGIRRSPNKLSGEDAIKTLNKYRDQSDFATKTGSKGLHNTLQDDLRDLIGKADTEYDLLKKGSKEAIDDMKVLTEHLALDPKTGGTTKATGKKIIQLLDPANNATVLQRDKIIAILNKTKYAGGKKILSKAELATLKHLIEKATGNPIKNLGVLNSLISIPRAGLGMAQRAMAKSKGASKVASKGLKLVGKKALKYLPAIGAATVGYMAFRSAISEGATPQEALMEAGKEASIAALPLPAGLTVEALRNPTVQKALKSQLGGDIDSDNIAERASAKLHRGVELSSEERKSLTEVYMSQMDLEREPELKSTLEEGKERDPIEFTPEEIQTPGMPTKFQEEDRDLEAETALREAEVEAEVDDLKRVRTEEHRKPGMEAIGEADVINQAIAGMDTPDPKRRQLEDLLSQIQMPYQTAPGAGIAEEQQAKEQLLDVREEESRKPGLEELSGRTTLEEFEGLKAEEARKPQAAPFDMMRKAKELTSKQKRPKQIADKRNEFELKKGLLAEYKNLRDYSEVPTNPEKAIELLDVLEAQPDSKAKNEFKSQLESILSSEDNTEKAARMFELQQQPAFRRLVRKPITEK